MVSFVQASDAGDFFHQDKKYLAFENDELKLKTSLLTRTRFSSAFCLERFGDGFKLKTSDDNFLDNRAEGVTRNINLSGTFEFVSSYQPNKYTPFNRKNFKIGNHGYLALVENNTITNKIDNNVRQKR